MKKLAKGEKMIWIFFITANKRSVWVRFLKDLFGEYKEFRFVPLSFRKAEKAIPEWSFIVLLDIVGCRKTKKELAELVRLLTFSGLLVVPFVPPHTNIPLIEALAKAGAPDIIEHGYEPSEAEKVAILYDILIASSRHLQLIKVKNRLKKSLREREG